MTKQLIPYKLYILRRFSKFNFKWQCY